MLLLYPNLLKLIVDIRYLEIKVDTGSIQHNNDYYDADLDSDNDHQHYNR